jgi:putative Holliday junction resolvase
VSRGTVLAFDYGVKRTGVASGELEIGVAHPLTTIQAESRTSRFAAIDKLVAEWRPGLLVIGLPSHPDGAEHEITRAARNFASELGDRYKLPVFLHDERYSSATAESESRELKHAGKLNVAKSRTSIDALAAQIILQGFFDERATA